MEQKIDNLLESVLSAKILKPTLKKCRNNHCIEKICLDANCNENSLHCSNSQCPCYESHILCTKIEIGAITKLLEDQNQHSKKYALSLHESEKQMIEGINQSWQQLTKNVSFYQLSPRNQEIVNQIYNPDSLKELQAKQADQLFKTLANQKKSRSKIAQICFNEYCKEAEKISKKFAKLKQIFYEKYCDMMKKETILAEIESKSLILLSSQPIFDSKIIKKSKSGFEEQKKFLFEALEKPREIQLLFRASEHNFRAAEFHKYCDGIANTLTIVKTQYGKIIGGYTPIPWKSSLEGQYRFDQTSKSCLFQVNLKQKMTLNNTSAAVCWNTKAGPLFGRGHDLAIYDKCNSEKCSYSCFPNSYNYEPKPYISRQSTNRAFSGSYEGPFKIIEYQVFAIKYE